MADDIVAGASSPTRSGRSSTRYYCEWNRDHQGLAGRVAEAAQLVIDAYGKPPETTGSLLIWRASTAA
jgi:hypothetical protein